MALQVVSITPEDSRNDVPIDSKIVIEFDGPIDPFTVYNGISIYCDSENLWSGPGLASLDTKYRDVLQIGSDYAYYPVSYSIVGNTVTITPQVSLLPDKAHYVSVLPGNDASRYVSAPTTTAPIYDKQDDLLNGEVDILSAYTGTADGSYLITFSAGNTIDVVLDAVYLGSFVWVDNEPVDLGDLTISITGTWTDGDTATIAVLKAAGVSIVYKNVFTTSKYTVTSPTSIRLEEKLRRISALTSLKVLATIPQGLSVNNSRCNPISIKFNKTLDPIQDYSGLISITKTSLETGRMKAINYYAKPAGDTLKIYLSTVNNNLPVDQALTIDDALTGNGIREQINILG